MFKVGDRVRLVGVEKLNGRISPGCEGTVVSLECYSIGVAFDEDVGGHDCRGACIGGHGWFCLERDLERVDYSSECEIEYEYLMSII